LATKTLTGKTKIGFAWLFALAKIGRGGLDGAGAPPPAAWLLRQRSVGADRYGSPARPLKFYFKLEIKRPRFGGSFFICANVVLWPKFAALCGHI